MLAHDVEHGGEAEAGAVFLGGEEGVENLLEVLRRDAVAVVLHLELHVVAGGQRRNLALGERGVAGAQPHVARAALGHGLHGVDHEVLEDLQDLRAVGEDVVHAGHHLDHHLGAGAGGGDARGILQHREGGQHRLHGGAALGEGEELLGQTLGGHARILAVLERRVVAIVLRERDAAEDGGQKIVEVVRDAAGEHAKRFETVGLDEFLGGQGHLQGVAEDNDRAGNPAVGVPHRAPAEQDGLGFGLFAACQDIFVVERDGFTEIKEPAGGELGALAAHAMQQREKLEEQLAAQGVRLLAEKLRGLVVGKRDAAGGVGEHEAFVQFGQRPGQQGGGNGLPARHGQLRRQRAMEADHAEQFVPARHLAEHAAHHPEIAAVLMPQAAEVEVGGFAAMPGEKKLLRAGGRVVGMQHARQGLGSIRQIGARVAEQALPGRREPVAAAGEVQVEGAEVAALRELPEPLFAFERGFLKLLAFGDVEMHAGDALELPVGAEHLQADAVDPHVVPLLVSEAILD